MAFLPYFFVLLVMASSVLFGLDWVKAPLHAPVSQQRTEAGTPGGTSEKLAQQKPRTRVAAVPLGRTQGLGPSLQAVPEAVAAVEQRQPDTSAPDAKLQQQPSAGVAALSSEPTQGAASASVTSRARGETTGLGEPAQVQNTPAETSTADAKRHARELSRARSRVSAARRQIEREKAAWQIRGAEAARRMAKPRQARAPAWALQGAEAARRQAQGAQAPVFQPFWVFGGNFWH
jgi:hypothetical protein